MIKKAYIAGGCFWGMEKLFRTQVGIVDTEVGYVGGKNIDPTYEFHPGHAEAVELTYDDEQTSYKAILDFFFRVHNPTTIDQQGNDMGSSYRSAIFTHDENEKNEALEVIALVNESGLYDGEVVTTLEPFISFYPAEEYHQDYLEKNPNGYTCHFVRSSEGLLT
jgi:peptide-methionine (S)-S-oxide reductase